MEAVRQRNWADKHGDQDELFKRNVARLKYLLANNLSGKINLKRDEIEL